MAFERFHLDPDLPRNLRNASNLRAEYLRGLLTRLVHVRPGLRCGGASGYVTRGLATVKWDREILPLV